MKNKKTLLVLVSLLAMFVFCTKEQEKTLDVVDLIPQDNEISGWTRSSAMQLAENETQLYSLIDGEADGYVTRGFVKCAFQSYLDAQGLIELRLRIFDQGDSVNAKSVYDFKATGSETPWTDNNAGSEARYKVEGFSYTLEFWSERFYVYINIADNTQAGLDVAKLFALNVSEAIKNPTQK